MEKPELARGPSAYALIRLELMVLPICVLGLAGVPLSAWLIPTVSQARAYVMIAFSILGACGGAALIVIGVLLSLAMRREAKAGYTTLYDSRKTHLWQLDSRTGDVIRRPGQPVVNQRRRNR